ncbi:MAG TPA: diguanylate cyclase [Bauldia sp.]|nr:diguanylate cyclase [Bauldia sp.]
MSHDTSPRFGLAARLALVVACAALPALLFLGVWVETQRRAAYAEAQEWTQRMAVATAERHADFYQAVRSTLEMLAISPAIRHADGDRCSELLQETQRRRPWMANAWVVDDAGRVVCSTDGSLTAPALDSTTRAEMAAREFGLSDIQNGDADPLLLAAMNVQTVNGSNARIHMIVESRLHIGHLAAYAELAEQRDGGLVIALDRKGRALSYSGDHKEHIGKPVGSHPTIQALLANGAPLIGAVHDGIDRIFAAATVPGWGATVVVGIAHDTVLATSRQSLAMGVAVAFLILLATATLAWFSADRLIMRSVRVVRDAAVAMADGAMGRRADVGSAPREIRQLATAFNRMTERLEKLALHDQLTGLPNRRYLSGRLAELERAKTPVAVLVMDTDDFKQINDRHGHAVGDVVLQTLGNRVQAAIGDDGFCARIGGDEFAIVVPGVEQAALPLHLLAVAERVRAIFGEPVAHEALSLSVTGSIGGAVRDSTVADLIQLFHNADRALYAAKAAGRNCLVIFDGTQPDTVPVDRRGARTAAA